MVFVSKSSTLLHRYGLASSRIDRRQTHCISQGKLILIETYKDIRRQFLVESAIITLVSGIGGLTAGVGICLLLRLVPLPDFVPHPVISPIAIAASLTTLAAITLLAGMYPAVRAADLSPMECLRTE